MRDLDDPTNRDSVHAMLTPGEFVLNKEASTMFAPIIEQMNNAGLQQRQAGNAAHKNMGGMIPGYNTGGFFAGNDWDKYASTVGQIESGNRYNIRGGANNHYVGRFQLGTAAIKDAAKRLGIKTPSKAEVQSNPELQDKLFRAYTEQNHQYLMKKQPERYGSLSPRQQQEVLGYAHNQGAGGASKWLATGEVGSDAFGTKGTKYSDALSQVWGDGQQSAPVPQQAPAPQMAHGYDSQPVEAQDPRSSFGEAFAAARKAHGGGGGVFAHNGKQYSTNIAEEDPNMFVNNGGPVHLNVGGWWNSLFDNEDQNAGYANYNQQDFLNEAETFNNPGAQTQGYSVPNLPSDVGGNAAVPQMMAPPVDPSPSRATPPAPPAPNSDEALLQNSSQADMNQPGPPPEIQEIYGDIWNQLDAGGKQEILKSHGYNERNEKLSGAVQSGIIGPDSAPSPEYVAAQVESGNLTVPQLIESGAPPEMVQAATDQLVNKGGSGLVPPSEIDQEFVADQTPAAQAIASGEVTPQEALVSDTFDPRGKDQRTRPEKDAEIRNVVSQEPPEETAATNAIVEQSGGVDAVRIAGEAAIKEPGKKEGFMSALKGAFGDLFDSGELARAAILMAGGMATGMSAQQALAFAGKGYINRIDAKAANHDKRVYELSKGAKHTPGSIAAYKESGDPADLIAIAETPERTGNFETFYQNGRQVRGEEVKLANGSKVYVDSNGKPINQYSATTDASRSPGTQEYRDRVTAEAKDYGVQVQNLVDRHGTTKDDGNTFYRTGIEPKKAGRDIAAFALKHNIPPEAMGAIIENAYLDAHSSSVDGKKANDITPYLNTQFVEATVGDPTLFQLEGGKTADAEAVQQIINGISTQVKSRNPERYGGLSNTAISTQIMQVARGNWAKLGSDVQQSYKPRKGETPFMAYLRAELSQGI